MEYIVAYIIVGLVLAGTQIKKLMTTEGMSLQNVGIALIGTLLWVAAWPGIIATNIYKKELA